MKYFITLIFLMLGISSQAQTYKLYQTDNIHNQLRLNTKTGEVYQIQDDGQKFVINYAVTPDNESAIDTCFIKLAIYGRLFSLTDGLENYGNVNLVLKEKNT